ncbi:hypothetical protein BXP70_16345 [Hymenobacter crusticola]|uniref:Uncharacterized protein n=2 Tax=Hymenobacter crusticola TaxID=1770526 RepID=A0A243WBW4_9BACT|nr:hypothetical protein BXP70_16345 [Hymenobacter crusticola]
MSVGGFTHLASAGVSMATRKHNPKASSNKPDATVTHFRAGNKSIPQKRTPEDQIRGRAAEDIKTLEGFLTAAQEAYARPEEKNVCHDPSLAQALIANIKKLQPSWSVVPYQQELAFYVQEQKRRQQPEPGSVTP